MQEQRATGVKDAQAAACMERARKERERLETAQPGISEAEKDEAMMTWLRDQQEKLNPFFKLAGKQLSSICYIRLDVSLLGFDPHRDTPVESLHTILLGIIKYLWALTCKHLASEKKLDELTARLRSFDVRGLNISPLRAEYLVQYRGALIGRQFKALVQAMFFVAQGLVPEEYLRAWNAAGALTARLSYPEIDHMNDYIVSRYKRLILCFDTEIA